MPGTTLTNAAHRLPISAPYLDSRGETSPEVTSGKDYNSKQDGRLLSIGTALLSGTMPSVVQSIVPWSLYYDALYRLSTRRDFAEEELSSRTSVKRTSAFTGPAGLLSVDIVGGMPGASGC